MRLIFRKAQTIFVVHHSSAGGAICGFGEGARGGVAITAFVGAECAPGGGTFRTGTVDYVAGDADLAAFQVSEDGTTCAVLFMRANLSYKTRLMSCKGVDGPKDKLLKLPRPD